MGIELYYILENQRCPCGKPFKDFLINKETEKILPVYSLRHSGTVGFRTKECTCGSGYTAVQFISRDGFIENLFYYGNDDSLRKRQLILASFGEAFQ